MKNRNIAGLHVSQRFNFLQTFLGLVPLTPPVAAVGATGAREIDGSAGGTSQAEGSRESPYGSLPDSVTAARALRDGGQFAPKGFSIASLVVAFALCNGSTLRADDFAVERTQVLALGQLTAPPVVQPAAGFTNESGMKAIFFDALPWQGRPTKVFAWLGLPQNRPGKVPGVVLVHGGGGTAFTEWVRKWNERGFAAISIAVEGQTDQHEATDSKAWRRHEWAGPARDGIYGDSGQSLTNQWMYHAVADSILAHSLLRSLPEVDAEKLGIMGISWGGVITSTVIGIDARFAFAIPTYGCGNLAEAGNQYGRALGNNQLYRQVWDPMVRVQQVKVPTLWFSWPGDQHFPLDKQAACYRAAPGPHMVSLIPGMQHSHGAGWNPPDSYAFAESIVREGKPWCVERNLKVENGIASCEFTATKPLAKAELVSTADTGFTGARKWNQSPAQLSEADNVWRVSAPLPEGTTAWFINVHSGQFTASSDFQEQPPTK